jgi:hypothetical protein
MVTEKRPRELSEPELREAAPRRISGEEKLLALALLGPPMSWAAHLTLSYGFVYPAERWQSKTPLYLLSAFAAVPAVLAVVVGLRGLRRARAAPALDEAQRERVRFMSACACLAGAFFLVAVLAQTVPVLILALGSR